MFDEYEVEVRLYDNLFVCSSERCMLPELRLELLRDAVSNAGSLCCVPSNDVESAGGVGGLYTSSATVAMSLWIGVWRARMSSSRTSRKRTPLVTILKAFKIISSIVLFTSSASA